MKQALGILTALVLVVGCATQPQRPPPDSESTTALETASSASGAGRDTDSDPNEQFEAELHSGHIQLSESSKRITTGRFSGDALFRARAAVNPSALVASDLPDGVQIHIFSVGQADSMLIIGPPPARKTLLVDVGELNWNSSKNCQRVRARVKELTGRYSVDYLLLTHFHLDHAGYPETTNQQTGKVTPGGGLFCLLDGGPAFFKVGAPLDPGDDELPYAPERPASHQAVIDQAAEWIRSGSLGQRLRAEIGTSQVYLGPEVLVDIVVSGGRASPSDPGALARLKAARPDVYSAQSAASPNDFSVGFELSVGEFEMFSAGDLSGAPGRAPYPAFIKTQHKQIYTNVETHLVEMWKAAGRESDVEIYRANHHGSGNSSTTDLLDALKPELVIYSCGGKHSHPDSDVVDRVHAMGAEQLITTAPDTDPWQEGFPARFGLGWDNPVGDISISVPRGGKTYMVTTNAQSFEYQSKTDREEARGE